MSDLGHGWVTPRKDGYQARCGGPSICPYCQAEKADIERREYLGVIEAGNKPHQGPDAAILAQAVALEQGHPRVLPGRVRVLRAVVYEGSSEAVAEQIGRSLAAGVHTVGALTIKVVSGPLEMQLPDGTWEKVP